LLQRNASLPILGRVECFADLGGGRIVVGGDFHVSNQLPRKNLALLGPEGMDVAFALGAIGPDGAVKALARQSDGKLVLAGEFLSVDEVALPGLGRLEDRAPPPLLSAPSSIMAG